MRPVSVMIVLTALLCVVVAVVAYFVTSALVSGRIEKLTERMREVEQGNLEVAVDSEAKDEIGLLYRGFGKDAPAHPDADRRGLCGENYPEGGGNAGAAGADQPSFPV